MSYEICAACMRMKMPGIPKNVLMQLAQMSNDHGFSWPSIEFLCMRTSWSRTAVIDALNFLEEQGVIWRDKANGRGTKYWVTPANWKGEVYVVSEKDQSAMRTGPPRGRVREADPTSPPCGPHQSAMRTLIPLNTKEPNTPQPPTGGGDGFDEFFAIFPKQVDQDKARDQWHRLAPDEVLRATIMAAVMDWRVAPQWERSGGTFVPKPHNWLRNKGWRNVPGIAPLPRKPTPPPVARPPAAPMPASVAAAAARILGPRAKSETVRASAQVAPGCVVAQEVAANGSD